MNPRHYQTEDDSSVKAFRQSIGTTTSPATNVTVNTSNTVLYADNSFASTNQPIANANGNAGTSGWQQTNEVHFIYDGNLVVQERDTNNLPQVTYTRGNDLSGTLQGAGGIDGLLARTDNSSQAYTPWYLILGGRRPTVGYVGSAYYHSDGNGNVTCLIYPNQTIAAKYLYDPYGNMLSMYGSLADANTYRFSSKEWNANSGLYYYLYRLYDASVQRWVNRDPVGEYGGLNLYSFVENSPVAKVDVRGLCPDCESQLQAAEDKIKSDFKKCMEWAYGIYGGLQGIARPRPPITLPGLLAGAAGCGAKAIAAQDAALASYAGCEAGATPEPPYHAGGGGNSPPTFPVP